MNFECERRHATEIIDCPARVSTDKTREEGYLKNNFKTRFGSETSKKYVHIRNVPPKETRSRARPFINQKAPSKL